MVYRAKPESGLHLIKGPLQLHYGALKRLVSNRVPREGLRRNCSYRVETSVSVYSVLKAVLKHTPDN